MYIKRDHEAFSTAVYNGMFNKSLKALPGPDSYVPPSSVSEVSDVIKDAAKNGMKVAVRSGGCSWVGASCRDNGLLVDMHKFNSVTIHPSTHTARVGPAVRGGDLGKELASQGFAFPLGHCGRPGVGGYLLGGGLGLNWGSWKPACFSIRSIEVVSPTGDVLRSSVHENPDYLYMARGIGPAFPGIITEFELDLQQLPAATMISQYLFSLDDASTVAKWLEQVSVKLPKNVEVAFVTFGPSRPFLPPEAGIPLHVVGVTAINFASNIREAREVLSLFTQPPVKPLLSNEFALAPFESLHEIFDASFPSDHHYLADTFWSDLSTSAIMERISDVVAFAPSGRTIVMAIMPGHGAGTTGLDLEHGHAAYSMDFRTLVLVYSIWSDSSDTEINRQWMNKLSGTLEKVSQGHFINEADMLSNPTRTAGSFSPRHLAKLQELKRKHDPENLFFSYPGQGLMDEQLPSVEKL